MSFGIMGMSIGTVGFILSRNALAKVSKLENQLKETGVLDRAYESGKEG